MKTVALGMSGGVDSSVAALLLLEAGYDVHGLYLDMGDSPDDAQRVSSELKIPLTVLDIRQELEERVCAPFVRSYLRGETPNPCIDCNPNVKFRALLEFAEKLGADNIATGHYARVLGEGENARLYAGLRTDQSYMLCRLSRRQLEKLLLPLGTYGKSEVRELARRAGLSVADKPDSMEICFIPDGDYAAYIESRGFAPPEGDFIDADGNILGRHRGIHRYTVGQSRGLGIALGRRMFVKELRDNAVVLSPDSPRTNRVIARDFIFLTDAPIEPFRAGIKLRHTKTMLPATVTPDGDSALIAFDAPVRAAAPGQTAALYSMEGQVLGGGIIGS